MRIYKKIIATMGVSIIALGSLAGCSAKPASGEQEKLTVEEVAETTAEAKTELVFVNYRDIRDLNPHLYGGEMYAQELLYESLVTITENGYEACLAESWEITDQGKVYTFKLREDVTFSDGEKFNADAVKKNFDAILENKERHTWLEMMQLLTGVEVVDEYTFRITLSAPYYPMLTELGVTRPFRFVSPKAMKDGSTKDGVNEYIGTGPYVLSESVTDQYALFTANENYWGEIPEIKKITVKVIPDNQTRMFALEKGEIDLIFGKNMIDAEAINKYKDNDQFEVALSDPTSTRQIVINTTNDILQDINVRKALQHAVSKETISEGIFYGIESPADTLFSKTVPYADVELEPYAYSHETAMALLEEAGWKVNGTIREKEGKKLAISLLYNSDSVAEKNISEYLQSEFLKLGIELAISGEEEQSYRDNMKAGNFDLVFNICWGTPYDPQSSLAAMRQPVYGDYAAQLGLHDKKEIDESITKILTSTDEEERKALYEFVLTRLHEDAVYIPLTYERNRVIYRSDLKNVNFTQTQYEVPMEEMYFE